MKWFRTSTRWRPKYKLYFILKCKNRGEKNHQLLLVNNHTVNLAISNMLVAYYNKELGKTLIGISNNCSCTNLVILQLIVIFLCLHGRLGKLIRQLNQSIYFHRWEHGWWNTYTDTENIFTMYLQVIWQQKLSYTVEGIILKVMYCAKSTLTHEDLKDELSV